MTMEQLAAPLKLTYQQLQKYETGRNRIAASRLYRLSEILGVPVGAFFEESVTPTAMRARTQART